VRVASIEAECTQVGVRCTVALTAHTEPPGRAVNFSFPGGGAGTGGSQLEYTGDQTASFIAGNQNLGVTVHACDEVMHGCCAAINVHLVGACEPNLPVSPSYVQTDHPPSEPFQPNAWGEFRAWGANYKGVGCIDTENPTPCAWRLRVTESKVLYFIDQYCPSSHDINSASDPLVTEANYCAIDESFTVAPGTQYPYPPFTHYCSSSCILAHENQHFLEFVETWNTYWPSCEADLENLAVQFVCDYMDSSDEAMQYFDYDVPAPGWTARRILGEWLRFARLVTPNHPYSQAGPVGNACVEELRQAISTRAIQEQWCAPPCFTYYCGQ
jgi:hypothetical protein